MEAQIRRMLVRSAENRGWEMRRDGYAKEECPFIEQHLKAAWKFGWEKANKVIF